MAENFTPLFDDITEKHGLITSAVYGYIWRKCQLDKGVCNASFQTMANDLNVSRRTIVTHVKLLVSEEIIHDLTPNADRKPHKYIVQTREINTATRETNALVARENGSLDFQQLGQEIPQLGKQMQQTREINAPKDTIQERDNNNIRGDVQLIAFFEGMTGFIPPHDSTDDYADKWVAPIQAIINQSSCYEQAETRLTYAILEMRKKGYTIKSPKSLLTFALNWSDVQPSPNGNHANGAASDGAIWDTVLSHARRGDPNFTDPTLKTAVRVFGWRKLQEIKPGSENFYRKDFLRVYHEQ